MNIKDSDRMNSFYFSWSVLTILLLFTFGVILLIRYEGVTIETQLILLSTAMEIDLIISGILSATTTLMNFVITFVINILTRMEKHETKTNELLSRIYKTIFTQAINTVFIYYFLYLIKPIDPLLSLGLVDQVYSLLVTSSLINIFKSVWNPKSLWHKLVNKLKYKKIEKKENIQIRLNQ